MKFGGSSVADADRMREVAGIICSFPEQLPCVVLSAMGKVVSLFTSIWVVTHSQGAHQHLIASIAAQ